MSDFDVEGAIGEPPAEGVIPKGQEVVVVQPKKKGRTRKGRVPLAHEVLRPAAPAPAPAPAPARAPSSAPQEVVAAAPGPLPKMSLRKMIKEEPTKSILARWPLVLELLRELGLGPDAVVIRIARVQLGPYQGPGGAVSMGPGLDGAQVAGNDQFSPGDDLVNVITELYHLSGRKGPAKYMCEVNYKVAPPGANGGTIICVGDLVLDDPDLIIQQRRRAEEFNARRAPALAQPRYPSFGAAGSSYVPQAVQAGALAPNQQIEDLRREMARLIGGREATAEMQALLSQQQQQQPVPYVAPAAAPPPPPMSEQERQWIEEGRFRMMAERLGYVPRDSVGVGAPPPQLQAQPPAQAVAAGVTDPLAGLNSLIKGLEGLELLKPRLAKLVGVAMPSSSEEGDEEETVAAASKPDESNPLGLQEVPVTRFLGAPVMFPTKAEGIVETVQSFLMANPAIAMEAMTRLGTILNSGAFAKLLERLTGAGGAPAQAAQQAVAQGLVGTGAHALTNGAAAAALAPLGAPVTPAPPPPFRGPRA